MTRFGDVETSDTAGELAAVEAELERVTSAQPPCDEPACLESFEATRDRLRAVLVRQRDELRVQFQAKAAGR